MTFQPKKRKREKRQHEKHRSIKNRSKEILFIDHRLTEQRNAASRNLDRMTAMEIVRLMNREDRKVAIAVRRELPAIAGAVDAIVNGIRRGGRLFYVGAGSSGGMSADVWDFAETGAGAHCRGQARDYPRSGRSGGFDAELGAGFAGKEIVAERRGGGNRSERHDAVCAGGAAVCAQARRDDGGGDVQPAHAGGTVGENRDCAGSGAGSADGVDTAECGDVAKNGAEHAKYGSDGATGACV